MTTIELRKISPWLTTEEAAIYLRISTKTLLNAIRSLDFTYGHEYTKKNPRQKRSQFIFQRERLEKTWCKPVARSKQK